MRIVAFTLDNEEDVVIRNVYLVLSLVITTFFRFSFVARLKPCEMPYWFSMRLRLILENVVYLICICLWDSQYHNQCPISMFCCFAVLSYICCIFYNRTTARWQLTNKKWQTFLVFCHTLLLMSTLILPVIICKQKVLVGERLIDFLFIALIWVPFDFEYEHAHEDYTAPHPGPFSLSRWLTWTDQRCMVTNRWNEPKEDFNTNWNYLGIALTYSPLHERTIVLVYPAFKFSAHILVEGNFHLRNWMTHKHKLLYLAPPMTPCRK